MRCPVPTKPLPPIAQARRLFMLDNYWDVRILGRWYRVQAGSRSEAFALVRRIRAGEITETDCQGH